MNLFVSKTLNGYEVCEVQQILLTEDQTIP